MKSSVLRDYEGLAAGPAGQYALGDKFDALISPDSWVETKISAHAAVGDA